MRQKQVSCIAVLLCGVTVHKTRGDNTTYVVALLGQDLHTDTENTDIKYELVITNSASTHITVTITGIDGLVSGPLTVPGNAKKVHEFSETHGLSGSEYANKSFIIHSEGKFTLQVFTIRRDYDYTEGFLGIPVEQMTGPHEPVVYNYVVATFCATAGYCQLAIAATKDATVVSITLPSSVGQIVICKGKSFFKTGRDKDITLNKFDAIQIETTQDLTGTVIYSFEPIAVFAGSRNVTKGDVVAHTMEQLVPSSHWGTEYIVQNLGTNGYGDILKIVSRWSDTKVTMNGFPPLIMKNRYETVVRRLENGTSSHIQASHPIQVVQITGLAYGTTDDISRLSMTTVPSVQNSLQEPTTVSCYGETSATAQFHIVSEKLKSASTVVNDKDYSIKTDIKYTKYMIGIIESTASTYTIENTDASSVGGIMKCDTATMPTGVLFNQNVAGTTTTTATYTGGTCYEGGKASTTLGPSPAIPYTLDLETYPEHIFQLRVRACGEAVVQFFATDDGMDDSLLITLTHKQMTVTKCFPNCTDATTAIVPDTDSFNDVPNFNCEVDMAFFWFRQTNVDHTSFCCGIGVYGAGCTGADSDTYFTTAKQFKRVTMMGLVDDADFNWDFNHVDGCAVYDSDWRCTDLWKNCSLYGTDFCSSEEYSGFASTNCAKYCGHCFSDSYGRKFKVKLPAATLEYKLIVSPLNALTNVAVIATGGYVTSTDYDMTKENIVPGTRYDNGERYYDIGGIWLTTYTVVADDDVAITVLYSISVIKFLTYRVYPVDTYATEVMLLGYIDKNTKGCVFASEFDVVTVTAYHSEPFLYKSQAHNDNKPETLEFNSFFKTSGSISISGYMFVFDKPSTVFCGDWLPTAAIQIDNYFLQHMPTNTWSTEYVIPAFDPSLINRPFDAKLVFLANADNTIVNISGGFDATDVIYNRGDFVEHDIDAVTTYRITASEKIAVGMYLYDQIDQTKSSFHIMTPMENFHDTIITSVPNAMLDAHGFDVTDIHTYFVDATLIHTSVAKATDDSSQIYRHVSLDGAKYGMSVVRSTLDNWFVVPGNVKGKVTLVSEDICGTSTATVDDNIDNDCDGLVDEDVCYMNYGVYQEDNDLDGAFGDDCSETKTSPVVVSKPMDPVCFEIDRPTGQCWTSSCTCKCSWVAKYEAQKNLTHDELVEAQQEAIAEITSTLEVETDTLTSATAKKVSAGDERQSAANIGYIGVGLFALVFGTIIILDVTALLRDANIFLANLREGFGRLFSCFEGEGG